MSLKTTMPIRARKVLEQLSNGPLTEAMLKRRLVWSEELFNYTLREMEKEGSVVYIVGCRSRKHGPNCKCAFEWLVAAAQDVEQ